MDVSLRQIHPFFFMIVAYGHSLLWTEPLFAAGDAGGKSANLSAESFNHFVTNGR